MKRIIRRSAITVKAECSSCNGTGLYVGFVEHSNKSAAVCGDCDGTGCEEIRYKPFEKRKGRRGIEKVRLAWGRGVAITYAEFVAGKRPGLKGGGLGSEEEA